MTQRQNPEERKTPAKQPRTRAKSITKDSEPTFPEDQFRLMVEAVVDYAIYMLDPEGRIMSWNAGAQRLKGYSEAEVIGRHYSMFFTEDAIRAGASHSRSLNGRNLTAGMRKKAGVFGK